MHPLSILLLGLAMSADAFAAALGKGAAMARPRWIDALRSGLVFGSIATVMPLLGWWLGSAASHLVQAWDHWIAFVLLAALGAHMIHKALQADEDTDTSPAAHGLWPLAVAGIATSIDALTVGIGLAFVEVNILVVAVVIGLCTSVMVAVGVFAGRLLGSLIGRRAELAGGVVLVLVGASIVYEHVFA